MSLDLNKPSLLGLEPAALPAPEAQPYRRDQLAGWLYGRGAESFAAMQNLPGSWRAEVGRSYSLSPFVKTERFRSRDASVRYLFTLADGKQTEAVYMPYSGRKTLCYLVDGGVSGRVRVLRDRRARFRSQPDARRDRRTNCRRRAG